MVEQRLDTTFRALADHVKLVEPLARPVTLAEMRAEPRLAGMALLKRGQRLSVQPVMAHEWKIILELSQR